ncbi:MAG: EAL domain-containing protein [Pseudomonadota bacterium]
MIKRNGTTTTRLRFGVRRVWRAATHGLARRFGIVQTLTIVGTALALGIGTNALVGAQVRGEIEDRALTMANAQARLAGVQLADYRLEDLAMGLADLGNVRGVTSAIVVDGQGLLLSDGNAGGALFVPIEDPLIDAAKEARSSLVRLDDTSVTAVAPVFLGGGDIGAVRLELSLASMYEQLARLRRQTVIIAAVFAAAGLLATALLLKRTRRSLDALLDMTQLASDGEFGRTQVIRSNDEIQHLAVSFNRMLLRLRRSTVSRDHVNHIIQSMSEALLVVDANGRITLANRAASRLFGHTETGLYQKRLRKLVCRETTPNDQTLTDSIGGAPLETRVVTKREGRIPVLLSASKLPDGQATVWLAQDLRVRKLAYFDSVTDLPNRVQFRQELSRAVIEAQRERSKLAVFFVDLDHFKMINDSYGHDVGDRLLRNVAERLQGTLRGDDVLGWGDGNPLLARLGGDEFTIVCRQLATTSEAARIAERLLEALREPFNLGERQALVGASIGIALFPDHGTEPETLIQNADRAMYWAKERGRNAARFFEPMMDTAANQRLEIETELRRAVAVHGLCVYYQPQVDIASGTVVGCEALLRWHHPKLGAVSPGTFIPIAETSGVIIQIDRWVISTACEQLKRWAAQGLGDLRIAVNVTALTLQQDDFVDYTLEALKSCDADPAKLEIEVTERAAVSDLADTVRKLNALRAIGVQVAIDDFGTGYSSLSYLKQLPADRLKIDRSFVQDAHRNGTDRVVFKAIVDMAKAVGMEILAEGVETREQLAFLGEQGCHEYQGFFMSPAIAPDDVMPWLLERELLPDTPQPEPAPRKKRQRATVDA